MIHFNSSKILIPVDFSETSLLAIKHGAFTAQLTQGNVYLLHVINILYFSQEMFLPNISVHAQTDFEKIAQERLLQLAEEVKEEYGVEVECITKIGSPNREITDVAKEIEATLIVMGTHGYSALEELVIGSTALKVITKAPCPTMAMNSDANHKGYNKIVLPIDTSAHTRQKVNYSIELAKKFSASLHVIGLLGSDEESEKPSMELILHQIEGFAKKANVVSHNDLISKVKNRATATIDYVNKINADLIVIMTDQEAELSGFFLGPYSQQVIHLSKVPVICIRPVIGDSHGSILTGTGGYGY
ncbi:MAG: universal stress protein [Bacteroidota bacterium]|nr:universal stress protein [Bacteroidota bacterium]MDP3144807.1 universal stress protein [Bacteroidota bacterium]MDP3557822.1 universal stress protein [Bacteroidota bacterium]